MLRQLVFAAFMQPFWQAMTASSDPDLAAIAGKAVKEVAYHFRHAGEWVIRLGDGTEESARRLRAAAEELAPYVDELFQGDRVTAEMAAAGIAPEPAAMRAAFDATLAGIFAEAGLAAPQAPFPILGGRQGRHSEAMGHLLAELQYMQLRYPGAVW